MAKTAAQLKKERDARLANNQTPGMKVGHANGKPKGLAAQQEQARKQAEGLKKNLAPAKVYDDKTVQGTANTASALRATDATVGPVPPKPYRGVKSVANAGASDSELTAGRDGDRYASIINRGAVLSDQANQAKVGAYRNALPGHGNYLNEIGQSTTPDPYKGFDPNMTPGRAHAFNEIDANQPTAETGPIGVYQRQQQVKNMSPELAKYVLDKRTGRPTGPSTQGKIFGPDGIVTEDFFDGMGRPVSKFTEGVGYIADSTGKLGRRVQANEENSPLIRAAGRATGVAGEFINKWTGKTEAGLDYLDREVDRQALDFANEGEVDPNAPQVYRRNKETGEVEREVSKDVWVASDALDNTGVDKPDAGFKPDIEAPVIEKPAEQGKFPGSGTPDDPYILKDGMNVRNDGTGNVAGQAKNSYQILRDQGMQKLKPRDTRLGRQALGIPTTSNYQGGLRQMGGGSARGGRMAQVLADNRVKYADRHARQQQRQMQRVLRNTSGGQPGIANRQAMQRDIANQRTTAAADRRTDADILRTQMNNQSRERGQDLSYDASLRSTEATSQYRDQLIAQGYSEQVADRMAANVEADEKDMTDLTSFPTYDDNGKVDGYEENPNALVALKTYRGRIANDPSLNERQRLMMTNTSNRMVKMLTAVSGETDIPYDVLEQAIGIGGKPLTASSKRRLSAVFGKGNYGLGSWIMGDKHFTLNGTTISIENLMEDSGLSIRPEEFSQFVDYYNSK